MKIMTMGRLIFYRSLATLLLAIGFTNVHAQTLPGVCPALTYDVASTESQCQASGTISVSIVSNYSGTVEYAIVAAPPLFAQTQIGHYQSSPVFEALPSGAYRVAVSVTSGGAQCIDTVDVVVPGNYVQPVSTLTSTNNTACLNQSPTGSVTMTMTGGRGPFYFQLTGPVSQLIADYTTGIFTGLPAGSYNLSARDVCGNIQSQDFTIGNNLASYGFAFDLQRTGCYRIEGTVGITDNSGHGLSDPTGFYLGYYGDDGVFSGFNQIGPSPVRKLFPFALSPVKRDTVTVFIKDPCGNITSYFASLPGPIYFVKGLSPLPFNRTCNSFNIDLNYGLNISGQVTVRIACAPDPSLIDMVSNGFFPNLPYGEYCFSIRNSCGDSVRIPLGISGFGIPPSVLFDQECGNNTGSVVLQPGYQIYAPVTVDVIDSSIHPSPVIQSNSFPALSDYLTLANRLPTDKELYLRFTDACNNVIFVGPHIFKSSTLTRNFTVTPHCINQSDIKAVVVASGGNGSIDQVDLTLKKKGGQFWRNSFHQQQNDTTFTFYAMSPGTYYSEISIVGCPDKYYDTIDVPFYVQPSLYNIITYTCGASDYSVLSLTNGGLPPYMYEITGSTPNNIVRPPQSSNIMSGVPLNETLNLRITDVCGNTSINSVIVKNTPPPAITINGWLCPGNPVVIAVPFIAGATYQWRFNGTVIPTDPSDTSINIPIFQPTDFGHYDVDITYPGANCAVTSSIDASDQCNILAFRLISLQAKRGKHNDVMLNWKTAQEGNTIEGFDIERGDGNSFKKVGETAAQKQLNGALYQYVDTAITSEHFYRLKIMYSNGHFTYSPIVSVTEETGSSDYMAVSPNPFSDHITITYFSKKKQDVFIQLLDLEGRKISEQKSTIVQGGNLIQLNEPANLANGTYFLRMVLPHGTIFNKKVIKR